MPPNQWHLYKPSGVGTGLDGPLPGSGAAVLQEDSRAAALVDELEVGLARPARLQAPHQRLLRHTS